MKQLSLALLFTTGLACEEKPQADAFEVQATPSAETKQLSLDMPATLSAGIKVRPSPELEAYERALPREDGTVAEGQLSEENVRDLAQGIMGRERELQEQESFERDPCERDYRVMVRRRRTYAQARGQRAHITPRSRFMEACRAGVRCAEPRVVNGRVVSCSGGEAASLADLGAPETEDEPNDQTADGPVNGPDPARSQFPQRVPFD